MVPRLVQPAARGKAVRLDLRLRARVILTESDGIAFLYSVARGHSGRNVPAASRTRLDSLAAHHFSRGDPFLVSPPFTFRGRAQLHGPKSQLFQEPGR